MSADNQAFRLPMANGCSTWIRAPTRKNMDSIYVFLAEQSEGKKRKPEFTYGALSRATGINPHQVQFACQKMAFMKDPLIRVFTSTSGKKPRLRLHEKVVLLRRLRADEEGGE